MKFLRPIILLFVFSLGKAQVSAPDLRCLSVNTTGDITLTWIQPADPLGQFFSYEIFSAPIPAGPWTTVATITTYTQTTYTHVGANGNGGSKYYCIRTRWGAGGNNISAPLDSLRSIYLNLGGAGTGTATMVYNNLHSPRLPSTATTFTVMRQYPPPAWSAIKTTSTTIYNDVITICSVNYNYQIQLADASGCMSTSNYNSGNFKDQTPPDVPNNLLDSVSVTCAGQTMIGWNPSSYGDCAGYVIYQWNGSNFTQIGTVSGINNTVYTTTNTSASSASYGYAVASIDSCGNLGTFSTNGQFTIFLKTKYDVCSKSVNLTWNAYTNMPQGVALYKIYRSINGGPYVYIGNVNGNSYDDLNLTPGKTYCYKVRAVNTTNTITSSSNCSCFVATAPPASSFVYLRSASVDADQSVLVNLYCDTLVPCKGFNVLRSDDGITFSSYGFVPYSGASNLYFRDAAVSTSALNYFYKAEVVDSCGNTRSSSNIGKTVLLHVENDAEMIFKNNLSWNDYYTWSGGVAGYYVFRVINEVMDPVPVSFVPFGITTYTDNVEDIVSESGKVGYVVQAVEGFGNIHNLIASANSNRADAYVEAHIFVPNAFAPKGENRIWKPVTQYVEKTDYKLTVFSRLGQKVFETTDENEGWNGSGLEFGTYVYLITYKNSRGEFREQKGTVTLVR